ncbi:YBEY [Symbiodinium sp. CCMP2592]|nr:YBEY [Symbiodinium sp. CCMP2592]
MTSEISRTFRCKAVITDVDGTLMPFGKNKKISERNQQALQKAFDEGLAVCVATGRIPGPWYDELCAQVPLGPGVFANGALVLEPGPGPSPKILAASNLPAAAVEAVLEQTSGGRFGGLRILVLAATMWEGSLRYVELAPEGPTWATDLIRSAGEPDTVLLPTLRPLKDVHKFVLFTLPEEDGWAAMADVVDSFQRSLAGTGVAILDCGPRQCEILPPEVNKGTGVKKLLEGLGLSLDSALACGDAENDVEMLEMVGLGIAVGDGKPKALAAADIVVSPSTEDGVAEAIDIALGRPGRLAEDEAPDSLLSV